MDKKINLSRADISIIMNIKRLSGLLANKETHDPLWLGMAFGYAYAIITQSNPEDHSKEVAEVVLDLFQVSTSDITNTYHFDPVEELHKLK